MLLPRFINCALLKLSTLCFCLPYLQEIDEYLAQASDKGLKAIKKVGQNGLTIAANAVMQSAMKVNMGLICLSWDLFSMSWRLLCEKHHQSTLF